LPLIVLGDRDGFDKDSLQPAASGVDVSPSSEGRCALQTVVSEQEILRQSWRDDWQGDDDCLDQVSTLLSFVVTYCSKCSFEVINNNKMLRLQCHYE